MKCVTAMGRLSENGRTDSVEHDEAQVMSLPEKEILCKLIKASAPLEYPLRRLAMAHGPDAREYVIPDEAREEVLRQLYPFTNCPGLEDKRFDLHEAEYFRVGDYKVIREMGRNFLVSPYYGSSGGMVVDWVEQDMAEGMTQVMMVQDGGALPEE